METMELRHKEIEIIMTNQAVIELAYVTKELIENARGAKLFFEQCNCYRSCFENIQNLLNIVDPEYLAEHQSIKAFYSEFDVYENVNS